MNFSFPSTITDENGKFKKEGVLKLVFGYFGVETENFSMSYWVADT